MTPANTSNNRTDVTLRESELTCKLDLCSGLRFEGFSDFLYVALGNLCVAVALTFSVIKLPLLGSILKIVFHSPKKQVVGIHTRRVIALVKNMKTFGDFSVVQYPRNAVRWSASFAKPNRAIPSSRSSSNPRPTFIRSALVNLVPKSLLESAPANASRFACRVRSRLARTRSSLATFTTENRRRLGEFIHNLSMPMRLCMST